MGILGVSDDGIYACFWFNWQWSRDHSKWCPHDLCWGRYIKATFVVPRVDDVEEPTPLIPYPRQGSNEPIPFPIQIQRLSFLSSDIRSMEPVECLLQTIYQFVSQASLHELSTFSLPLRKAREELASFEMAQQRLSSALTLQAQAAFSEVDSRVASLSRTIGGMMILLDRAQEEMKNPSSPLLEFGEYPPSMRHAKGP
ncbi:hypothetical protein AMTR_s00150p00080370 [Amborella trichopoda]|uniref:Uncharacterized protein n=1 Tax=Amborella trichopoda TaxID=13333 RepID=W1PL14_AMBTC|nr:hypothetical protein AMTR_s00150p00080370 [Amborella trichopoda]